MGETTETERESGLRFQDASVNASEVSTWFVHEVLPLEAILMHYLQHNWQNASDIIDLRQEVYVRLLEAAQKEIPEHTKRFVLITARNLLIDRVRREHVVPIDAVADVDALGVAIDSPGPDREMIARDELRQLRIALDRLPPRCREAIVLGHIEGCSGQEIAARMGVSEAAVSKHLKNGIRALTNLLYGELADRTKTS
ncbi:MAG TPA: RNA polymerase sigma factor [Rhizomicrobium sp.]